MSQQYSLGDRVHVKFLFPEGHIRTPAYVRGKTGEVVAYHGVFRNPETRALGKDGLPRIPLYAVSFNAAEMTGDDSLSPRDSVIVDIFEHWIEPVG